MRPHTLPIFLLSLSSLVSRAELVGYWTLEEGTGTEASDSTTNDRTGTIAGGATWSTTDLAAVPTGTTAALNFDGVDDQINITGYKAISGTGARTITAWIKTATNAAGQNRAIVSWGENLNGQKWTFRIQSGNGTDGAIRVEANGGYFVGNKIVSDTEWHHVALTWEDDGSPDVTDAKLYVDGVLDAELNNVDAPPSASLSVAINTASTADVRIGRDFSNRFWQGGIDDVRIYDEALDASSIAELALSIPVITDFRASEEVVASGSPVTLSWVSDAANDALAIDNAVGDVLGMEMIVVNPTETTTYTLTGTRGDETKEREVTVLVDSAPLINSFSIDGSGTILEGQSATVRWTTFGETSVSIDGADLTGKEDAILAPTETTTYTLTATNAFGSTTSEITITVVDGGMPNLSWDATGLPDGALAQWDPAINDTGNDGFAFINTTGGVVQSGSSNFAAVSSWVNSPGYDLFSNPNDSWQDGLGDLITRRDVSWEMVFRPGDFTGTHTLFNTGGNGDGTAIVLTDSTLDFRFQTAAADENRIILPIDLATLGNATDFFHIVATADVGGGVPGIANLYVNGTLVAGPVTSAGVIDDWDGGDLAELGKGGNIPGASPFPFEAFTGDIALFNYFGERLLNASQVTEKYNAISGGGSGLTITAVDYDLGSGEIQITFDSFPGQTYALETTIDLAATEWIEVNDSILADDTTTSVTLDEKNLTDSGSPRRFFRIKPGL